MVSGSMLRFGPEHALFKALPVELQRRLPISIITLTNRTIRPVAKLFIECAREFAKPLAKAH
jgi:hypothetical protein